MTEPVEFEVNISEDFYYKIDTDLANKIHLLAQKKGISPENLINWIREKLQSEIV